MKFFKLYIFSFFFLCSSANAVYYCPTSLTPQQRAICEQMGQMKDQAEEQARQLQILQLKQEQQLREMQAQQEKQMRELKLMQDQQEKQRQAIELEKKRLQLEQQKK